MLSRSFEEGRLCGLLLFPHHFTLLHSAYCPRLLVIHKVPSRNVLTNDSTDFDSHFEVVISVFPVAAPTDTSLFSFAEGCVVLINVLIKSWRKGAQIHRFSHKSPPRSVSEEGAINSIFFSVYLLLPYLLSLSRSMLPSNTQHFCNMWWNK